MVSQKSPARRRAASSPSLRRKRASLSLSKRSPVKRRRTSSPSVHRRSTRSTYTIRSKRRAAKDVALSSGHRVTFYVSATEFGGRYKVPIRINNPRLAAVRFISKLGAKRAFVYMHPAGGKGIKYVAHVNPKNPRLPIVRSGTKFQSPTKSRSQRRRAPAKRRTSASPKKRRSPRRRASNKA